MSDERVCEASQFIGTKEEPPREIAEAVEADATCCAICGYWSWADAVDSEGTCEGCCQEQGE